MDIGKDTWYQKIKGRMIKNDCTERKFGGGPSLQKIRKDLH